MQGHEKRRQNFECLYLLMYYIYSTDSDIKTLIREGRFYSHKTSAVCDLWTSNINCKI